MSHPRETIPSVSHSTVHYPQWSDEPKPQETAQPQLHHHDPPNESPVALDPKHVKVYEGHNQTGIPPAVESTTKPHSDLLSKPFDKFVLVGNPGSGKSTFINCILKEAKFNAGLSFGGGCTQFFQVAEHNDRFYLDTPGLSDTLLMERAAQEIKIALTQGGRYHLLFVVRLSSGRVDKDDINTINRVLSCIKTEEDSPIEYSVIVNMVRKKQYKAIMAHGDEYINVITCLNTSSFDTNRVLFVPEIEELDEEDNKVVDLPPDLLSFIHESPSILIEPSMVADIVVDPEVIEENLKQVEETIRAMQADKDLMLRRFQSLQHCAAHRANGAGSRQKPIAESGARGTAAGCTIVDRRDQYAPTQHRTGAPEHENRSRNVDQHNSSGTPFKSILFVEPLPPK